MVAASDRFFVAWAASFFNLGLITWRLLHFICERIPAAETQLPVSEHPPRVNCAGFLYDETHQAGLAYLPQTA